MFLNFSFVCQNNSHSSKKVGAPVHFFKFCHMGIPAHFFLNFWKLYAGKFLETICWEIFWKLYAGNLLMETMCCEIRVDAGGFLKGVITAHSYSIILRI